MTAIKPITEKLLASLKPPQSGRLMIRDAGLRGFCVQVTPTGVVSFYLVKRVGRKVQRVMLGRWPGMKVEQARAEAAVRLGGVASGVTRIENPRAAARFEPTLGEAFELFCLGRGATKRTLGRDKSVWSRDAADWSGMLLSSISRPQIRERMSRLQAERGPGAARKFVELLKAIYRSAITDRDWPGSNPTVGIAVTRPRSRERFIQPTELPRFFAAMEAMKSRNARDYFAVLLFTGARRSNVASMRKQELHLDDALWIIPAGKYKANRETPVVLIPEAVAIIRERMESPGEYIFPGRSRAGHYSCPKDAWRRVCETAGLPDLRIHDLRRTLGSYLAATNASLPIIGKTLGQTSPQATAVYARLSLGPVRDAVETAVKAMKAAGGGQQKKS